MTLGKFDAGVQQQATMKCNLALSTLSTIVTRFLPNDFACAMLGLPMAKRGFVRQELPDKLSDCFQCLLLYFSGTAAMVDMGKAHNKALPV